MGIGHLLTTACAEDVAADRRKPGALQKGQSRLQKKIAVKKLVTVTDAQFRAIVFDRDKGRCRSCSRKVIKTIDHVPEQAQVHHIHGRRGPLRHDDRAALLLCGSCHEKVTGKVNEKAIIEATVTFRTERGEFTDARQPVTFKRIA